VPLLHHLEPGDPFPPTSSALSYPNGLLAVGGALDSDTLLAAYRQGIFPWYEAPQPVLWWSPDPRSVLFLDQLHVSRSLRKTLRSGCFTLSADSAFADVMRHCAEPRGEQLGTWIDEEMLAAYNSLHTQGWAHSIEVWQDSELVGGLYGVLIGGAFFGESMFSRCRDASKVALVALVRTLRALGGVLVDCQVESEHLNSLGARNLSRVDFENRLQQTVTNAHPTAAWNLATTCDGLLL
jgi:leucyl/phenylalanyl-tRNA--protein transferase